MFEIGNQEEQRLVKRLRNGENGAMREFYSLYAEQLAGICSRYIPDGDDMKDVFQESLIRIFTHISDFSYQGVGSLKAWASRIVVNESLRFLSKAKQQELIQIDNPNIQQQMQQLEMQRVQYLGNLCWRQPDNYAAAALLEYMSYEMAPVLYDTVFNTLHREYPKDRYIQSHYEELRTMRMLAVGVEAPDFTLPDTNGVIVSLKDLRGKVVVVDFWASWCRPCRMENPNMVKLYQKYHEKGLEILGVSLDGDRESWMKAIHQDGLYWTQVSDLKRWNCAAARQYNVTGIPFTLLLDKEGKIVAKGLRGDDLLKKVEALLGE